MKWSENKIMKQLARLRCGLPHGADKALCVLYLLLYPLHAPPQLPTHYFCYLQGSNSNVLFTIIRNPTKKIFSRLKLDYFCFWSGYQWVIRQSGIYQISCYCVTHPGKALPRSLHVKERKPSPSRDKVLHMTRILVSTRVQDLQVTSQLDATHQC